MKRALLLIGCPEAPAQTAITVYTSYKLKQAGYEVVISANPAASKLLKVSDPEKQYTDKMVNIDSYINKLEEEEFDLLVGIIHKDAAVQYYVTYYHMMNTESVAVIFQKEAELVDDFVNQVEESTESEIIAARAYHNPTPLRVKIDKYIEKLTEE